MNDNKWIANLKIGDKVALDAFSSSDGKPTYVGILTVTGRTPKRVRCGEREYNLDGCLLGKRYCPRLVPYCESARVEVAKLREEQRRQARHSILVGKFMNLSRKKVAAIPDEILEPMSKLLDEGLATVEKGEKA